MMDIQLALISGSEIPILSLGITLTQPTIKDISFMGEEDFFTAIQCLSISKNQLKDNNSEVLQKLSNFEIFMMIIFDQSTKQQKEAIKTFFQLIFPKYTVFFTPKSISIQDSDNNIHIIDESNFLDFQDIIKKVFCLDNQSIQGNNYNPGNEEARRIAEKLQRSKQKIIAQKGLNSGSLLVRYISILTIGVSSMSLQDCLNLTLFQLLDLVDRYILYLDWMIDLRIKLAGGKSDNTPEDWMKNIH